LKDLDLASLESVRTFADSFLAEFDQLDIFIANAGVMCPPLQHTKEGFELQFGTNHLGHFVLGCRLVPALLKASPSRVVMVSSSAHRFSDIVFDDVNYNNRPYEKWPAYGQSKTANILYAVELNRRLSSKDVTVNAIHPGAIMTELSRHLTEEDIAGLDDVAPGGGDIHWKSVQAGAATSIWAATAPELEGNGGQYLEDCQISVPISSGEDEFGYATYARDPESARRLWALSEQLVGEQFSF
jgi:NAD(P)-dependent dehydrogenase (short-subunit alcohol dehydrogenase family)